MGIASHEGLPGPLNDTESLRELPRRRHQGKGNMDNEHATCDWETVMMPAQLAAGFAAAFREGVGAPWLDMKLFEDHENPPLLNNGKYLLVGKLGSGGMGTVWLAGQKDLQRYVAIKAIQRKAEGDDEEERANRLRADREAQIGGMLTDPGFVKVYESWHAKPRSPDSEYGEHFIAMEYVPHPTLKDLIKKQERLDLPFVLSIGKSAAYRLQHLHERRVVHRDLKPSNIFVAQVDGQWQTKVGDFGLARYTDEEKQHDERRADETITKSGTIIGTLRYCPPEQMLHPHTTKWCTSSDIYPLGMTLAECLRGTPPFPQFADDEPFSFYDLHRAFEKNGIRTAEYHPFVEPGTDVRRQNLGKSEKAFEDLYRRMVHPDPEQRIQTPEELIGEFERIELLREEQDGTSSQGQHRARRRTWRTLIGG